MAYFIAVEGLDGIGKSTIINGMAKVFSGHAMNTPGDALRDIRKLIIDDFADDELAKVLFYTATVSSQGKKARNIADSGEWVFMDRYWASTVAYAKTRGVDTDFNMLSSGLVQPDITILLTLDETERQRRLLSRGTTAEDLETLDSGFRQCVLDEYQTHATMVVDISGLDTEPAIQTLEQLITNKVKSMKS